MHFTYFYKNKKSNFGIKDSPYQLNQIRNVRKIQKQFFHNYDWLNSAKLSAFKNHQNNGNNFGGNLWKTSISFYKLLKTSHSKMCLLYVKTLHSKRRSSRRRHFIQCDIRLPWIHRARIMAPREWMYLLGNEMLRGDQLRIYYTEV